MAATILETKEYIKLLKSIRSAASEKGGQLEYTELKTFFTDIALTPKQAEDLWTFLDGHCIMIMHIDEADPLFASVPESEVPQEAEAEAVINPNAPVARRQDVSNVQVHSTAIGKELVSKACAEEGITINDNDLERLTMEAARKLASRLRPNEMYALYLLWKLDGSTRSADQISSITEVPYQAFAEVETKAKSCTPKLPGQKKGFLSFLFGR